jgi:phosphate/sulfate permease
MPKTKKPKSFVYELIEPFRFEALKLFFFKERKFFIILSILLILAGAIFPYPYVAMWVGFLFAGYSAIANDSIQTIGTFLASNAKRPWWVLWLFIGGIFVITMSLSWYLYDGDVSFQRLSAKGFDKAPENFQFLQLAAPLILLLLTRLRMPVSTTFLCLSAYSANLGGIEKMLYKSLFGYGIAFLIAIIVWFVFAKAIKRFTTGEAKPYWTVIQWVISGLLWAVWLMQDGANIAVTLPRELSFLQFLFFLGYVFLGLGLLFYLRGDKIQEIISEKTEVADVRGATLIDFSYALILLFFQNLSTVPMSTTWVFLGLLAGRELAMTVSEHFTGTRTLQHTTKLVVRDAVFALIGLVISILTAIFVNPTIQQEILQKIRG